MKEIMEHPLYRIHDMDSVISSLWEFYKKKFVVLFLVSLVMALITQVISASIDISELQTITDPEEMLLKMRDLVGPMIIISVISLFFSTILHFYVIYNPLDPEYNIVRCTLRSLRYFIPYIIIMILLAFFASFAFLLGIIALVIGIFFAALYVMVIYLFILPVLLSEGPLISNTLSRTIKLAHRNFWSNIGWTAVFVLLLIVFSVIMSGLILLPFSGNFIKIFASPEESATLIELASNPLYIALNAVVSALVYPTLPIFAVILYLNQRAREDTKVILRSPVEDTSGKVTVEDLYAKPLPEKREEDLDENR